MAEETLNINVSAKGVQKTKQELGRVISDVDKEVDRSTRKAGGAQRRADGGGGGGTTSRTAGGQQTGLGRIAGGAFLGTLGAQALQRSFSALSASARSAFDPDISPIEQERDILANVIRAVPIIGDPAAGIFETLTQRPVAVQQSVQQRLQGILTGGARAIGLANPNLQDIPGGKSVDEQLRDLILAQFGGIIKQLGNIERLQARTAGPLAEAINQGSPGLDLESLKNVAIARAEEIVGIDDFRGKLREAQNNLEEFGSILGFIGNQILDGEFKDALESTTLVLETAGRNIQRQLGEWVFPNPFGGSTD